MNARDFALLQLDAKHLPGWPNDVFRSHLTAADRPSDPRDAALAEHITIGVTKNLFLLRYLVAHYSGRALETIEPDVQKIICVALYQLRFLSRVPASAAVHQAVEQAKISGNFKASGFVNAVLRRATREPDAPLPPQSDAARFAEIALSHPPELFHRYEKLVGAEKALLLCAANNQEPPTIVRLGNGKTIEALSHLKVQFRSHSRPGLAVVEGARQAVLAEWAARGIAQVQDPTSAGVVDSCDLHPGQTILDRCCGLGTKTLQLWERIGKEGLIVGIDPSKSRIEVLMEIVARRGIRNIQLIQSPMMKNLPSDVPQKFDRALLDVPCSNSGVLSRRPEARFHQDAKALESLEKLQSEILEDSAPNILPGGLMVYSTCSVWPEENEVQIDRFIAKHPEFTLINQQITLPSLSTDPAEYHDGGFCAVLKRGA